jgi:hypothetical protein
MQQVVEASRFMFFGKRKGYRAYPVLALALAMAPMAVWAQSSTDQPLQSPDQQTNSQQTIPPSQRSEVLRQAQQRVMARRKLRIQQIIRDTYSRQYEIYAGGGYTRFRPGPNVQHNSEANWNVGITDYKWGNLGVTADFRGYYGTAFVGVNQFQVFKPSISQYTFMAGPQYRFFEGQHWGWSAFGLAGLGHGNFGTGTNGFDPTTVGLYPNGDTVNFAVGASVDYNVTPTLAFRLTPNYLYSHYGSDNQNNLGFNAGVVYRFGHR